MENASLGLTVCAERVAVFKAVSEGERDIETIVIYTETEEPTPPCGACRQVLKEFSKEDIAVVMVSRGKIARAKLSELLPMAFTGERLK